jgi:Cu-Zn family superoxide dismutase
VLIQADGSGRAHSVTGRFRPGALEGRAVILHAGPDNLANVPVRYVTGTPPVAGPDAATKATGDSGGRIACGVIVVD